MSTIIVDDVPAAVVLPASIDLVITENDPPIKAHQQVIVLN
jgi:hypothetical protein